MKFIWVGFENSLNSFSSFLLIPEVSVFWVCCNFSNYVCSLIVVDSSCFYLFLPCIYQIELGDSDGVCIALWVLSLFVCKVESNGAVLVVWLISDVGPFFFFICFLVLMASDFPA